MLLRRIRLCISGWPSVIAFRIEDSCESSDGILEAALNLVELLLKFSASYSRLVSENVQGAR